jgi:hypothetical protein
MNFLTVHCNVTADNDQLLTQYKDFPLRSEAEALPVLMASSDCTRRLQSRRAFTNTYWTYVAAAISQVIFAHGCKCSTQSSGDCRHPKFHQYRGALVTTKGCE